MNLGYIPPSAATSCELYRATRPTCFSTQSLTCHEAREMCHEAREMCQSGPGHSARSAGQMPPPFFPIRNLPYSEGRTTPPCVNHLHPEPHRRPLLLRDIGRSGADVLDPLVVHRGEPLLEVGPCAMRLGEIPAEHSHVTVATGGDLSIETSPGCEQLVEGERRVTLERSRRIHDRSQPGCEHKTTLAGLDVRIERKVGHHGNGG